MSSKTDNKLLADISEKLDVVIIFLVMIFVLLLVQFFLGAHF